MRLRRWEGPTRTTPVEAGLGQGHVDVGRCADEVDQTYDQTETVSRHARFAHLCARRRAGHGLIGGRKGGPAAALMALKNRTSVTSSTTVRNPTPTATPTGASRPRSASTAIAAPDT